MDKQEFMRINRVNQMPRMVQVLAGRLYDAAFEAGRAEGYRQGVDATIAKNEDAYKAVYEEGAKDANRWGSAAFTAACCEVMHANWGFGRKRLKRLVDGIGNTLITMISPAELIRKVRSYGIRIEYDDLLDADLEDIA